MSRYANLRESRAKLEGWKAGSRLSGPAVALSEELKNFSRVQLRHEQATFAIPPKRV